jgi:hypothetical protein
VDGIVKRTHSHPNKMTNTHFFENLTDSSCEMIVGGSAGQGTPISNAENVRSDSAGNAGTAGTVNAPEAADFVNGAHGLGFNHIAANTVGQDGDRTQRHGTLDTPSGNAVNPAG